MSRLTQAVLLATLLGVAACSDNAAGPRDAISGDLANRAGDYPSLDAEILATIPVLFPTKGLVTATGNRWETVKSSLTTNPGVAQKQLMNLSTFVTKQTLPSQKTEASRLILLMALYVYNGPSTPVPPKTGEGGATIQTAAGVVEPTTDLTLTTTHANGSIGDGGIHISAGSVSSTTIAVISEITDDYPADCTGPLNYSGCQQPKFFRITLFPHDKLLQPGEVQICHVNNGDQRRPLGDHDDLRVAHEKPANANLYTPGSTIVDGIEILPWNPAINFLNVGSEGGCETHYHDQLPVIGFLDRVFAPDTRLGNFARAVRAAVTPKSLYAVDLGGGGMFLSESIFGLVNSNIMLADLCNDCGNPTLAFKSAQFVTGGTQYNLTVSNRSSYPARMFAAAGSLAGCSDVTGATRTKVEIFTGDLLLNTFCTLAGPDDLDNLNFVWQSNFDAAPVTSAYIKMTDRLTRKTYTSNTVALSQPPDGGAPSLTSMELSSSTVSIANSTTSFTAVMNNPGTSSEGWVLQGYLVQGENTQPAGGVVTMCGSGNGVLPPGNCTQSFSVTGTSESGTVLAPGSATYRLELKHNGEIVDSKTVAVTLVP